MRLPVRQPLAGRVFDSKGCTFPILNTEFGASIVTEIIFGQVPMQMLFGAMLVNASHAAFKDAEISLCAVRMTVHDVAEIDREVRDVLTEIGGGK